MNANGSLSAGKTMPSFTIGVEIDDRSRYALPNSRKGLHLIFPVLGQSGCLAHLVQCVDFIRGYQQSSLGTGDKSHLPQSEVI